MCERRKKGMLTDRVHPWEAAAAEVVAAAPESPLKAVRVPD
jgi:hypothetical protein